MKHSLVIAIAATVLVPAIGLLLPAPAAFAQVTPDAWFFEIDADYGDWLENLWPDSDPLYWQACSPRSRRLPNAAVILLSSYRSSAPTKAAPSNHPSIAH